MTKGLEALYSGIEVNTKDYGKCTAYTPDCIDIIEKELKALEIIKNKRVDVDYFLTIIEKYNELEKQMKVYNHLNSVYEMLTQEEFELLKKVFYEMV